MSFSGFLASIGVVLLLIGVVIGLDDGASIFNPFFFTGAGLIVASIFFAIILGMAMGRMRARAGDLGDPMNDFNNQSPQPSAPVSGTFVNQPAQPQQTGQRRCQGCGRAGSGSFCDSCGTRL